MLLHFALWLLCSRLVPAEVLDPALYLLPSPPLAAPNDQTVGGWFQGRVERGANELAVVPLETVEQETESPAEGLETAETIWPSLRAGSLGVRSIHVPLTFAITGNYGRYGSPGNAGLIGSSYGVIATAGVLPSAGVMPSAGVYGKSALAGSGYSSYGPAYGTRIYGGSNTASWSGWGNGKWGHYGKG